MQDDPTVGKIRRSKSLKRKAREKNAERDTLRRMKTKEQKITYTRVKRLSDIGENEDEP